MAGEEYEEIRGPEFGPDTVEREVAMIILGAASLARRVFRADDYSIDALRKELLVALALSADNGWERTETVAGLAAATAGDEDEVADALRLLRSQGLARPGTHVEHGYSVPWELTGAGREAALEFTHHAARFIRPR